MQQTKEMLSQRWRAHPDTFVESGPDGIFMLLPDGQTVKLNEVAEFIWSRLDGHRTAQAILEELLKEFAVPSAEVAEADLIAFLEGLLQVKLIESA